MKRILIILIFCLTVKTFACDCIMLPIESYIDKVSFIFTGKVIKLLEKIDTTQVLYNKFNKDFYDNRSYKARVLIIEKYKTLKLKQDTLDFTTNYTNCDPLYELGDTLLFFADRVEGDKYMMRHCTYWGHVNESKENIKKIKLKLNIK